MFSLKNQINEKLESIDKIIPQSINLYDVASVNLTRIEIDKISIEALDNYFRNSISAIFNLNGEISGQAVCQLDSRFVFEAQQEELGLKELFIEASNVVIGHIISYADDMFSLMSHLSSPLVLNDQVNSNHSDKVKKLRVLSLLNKSLSDNQFYQLDYELLLNDEVIPFHIFLMIKVKEPHED